MNIKLNEQHDRMMIYAWEDLDSPNETKFGDHVSLQSKCQKYGKDKIGETQQYIYDTLGKYKYKWVLGRIVVHGIWDVTELAIEYGKYYQRSHMDDVIRNKILTQRIDSRSEFHYLPGLEVSRRVEKFLSDINAPKPIVGLSTTQYRIAVDIIDAVNIGKNTILAELCARFGKTIWAGVISKELNVDITLVVTYVKTVFTSFDVDLNRFEQFKHYVHMDSQDPDYQNKINDTLRKGKKIIVYLSMCQSDKRQERIDYLFNLDASRLVIIDEADFGVHRLGQARPLIKARKEDDVVLLMTGTNADRAQSEWEIDYMCSITYPELLIQKRLSANA